MTPVRSARRRYGERMAPIEPFQAAVSKASAKFIGPAFAAADMGIDPPPVSLEIFRQVMLANETMIRDLLAWRAALASATNVQPEDMAFLVPEHALAGVAEAFGSRVIHSAEVHQPMVAVAVPKLPFGPNAGDNLAVTEPTSQ
jgi:hypothetical protein